MIAVLHRCLPRSRTPTLIRGIVRVIPTDRTGLRTVGTRSKGKSCKLTSLWFLLLFKSDFDCPKWAYYLFLFYFWIRRWNVFQEIFARLLCRWRVFPRIFFSGFSLSRWHIRWCHSIIIFSEWISVSSSSADCTKFAVSDPAQSFDDSLIHWSECTVFTLVYCVVRYFDNFFHFHKKQLDAYACHSMSSKCVMYECFGYAGTIYSAIRGKWFIACEQHRSNLMSQSRIVTTCGSV